jgi:hypothetical protein
MKHRWLHPPELWCSFHPVLCTLLEANKNAGGADSGGRYAYLILEQAKIMELILQS